MGEEVEEKDAGEDADGEAKTEEEEPAGMKVGGGKNCKKGKKCKGKGKGLPATGKKCPSVDELEAWVMEEHKKEICLFSELGWMDNSGNVTEAMNEKLLADLS